MRQKYSRQHDPKCRLKSSQYTLIIPHRLIQLLLCIILGPRDKAAPPKVKKIGQFPPKRVKYPHSHPFLFFISSSTQESSLCSQPVRGKVRRTGRIFPEHAERSFLDPERSFVAVRRITQTRFAKHKFVQLRTNYFRRTFFSFDELGSRSKRLPS